MPSRSIQQRLQDILTAAQEIQLFTRDVDRQTFEQDLRTIRAVLYNFAIIGEAAASLLPDIEISHPEVPWKDLRGLRNIAIHEYFRVNLDMVWETIIHDLPFLIDQIQKIQRTLSD
ncbi:DUF86 domain-containing protein [Limnothrix sp. FACHB-1083]|uniref:HepT-like ribonuclease domain-containing protein n=1 Tax=unclassified Limnothrix TaxID=2632864 RepID=UPI0016805AF1|nr:MULTISPECIES: DUF86 domain-containing protein [unclassified Limnothrix]MBD2159397.1 DUF86 domain-containing protein [Limnothrix sp. FACHB-1083]MBD2193106.1 DUF86 domain-containing protein [Limnothrix sp. FACHB-1088]